ncbi:NACHT domain-containing protein [Rhizobium binxianense]|uniref:NACHT domain-containing protein n=1 Tax=Rhizobium binxianense TaxID=3024242 RepID=UPI00234F5E14|nr:hypothetical protein [Rhizobium sp. BC56]MDC7741234.1 hypothetical protein [Rhizobium sp. BC56]
MALQRTFQDVPEESITQATDRSFLRGLGWSKGATWEQLLLSQRVLIISEAGAGKTWECQNQAERLRLAGEPAFFVELATLATATFRETLDDAERDRLDQWIASQSETATFFLDSVDELSLTRTSFTLALKRFSDGIARQLGRARIVITSRPTPFDRDAIRKHLFIPEKPSERTPDEEFARIAMGEHRRDSFDMGDKQGSPPLWRTVALMPFSDEEITQFATERGLRDAADFVEDLRNRDALEFARRPLDLSELCTSWQLNKRIGTHREQVATDVRFKLRPRDDREEPAELTIDRAMEGAERLALAMVLTRRLTIRHGAESDVQDQDAAVDPTEILRDFGFAERRALLERALFGLASYGRVRFHHRSVIDYLAAERLRTLYKRGTLRFAALRDRIFTRTHDKLIVRPSMRAVAAWLAVDDIGIFELLRDNEPAVLLDEGDPRSLPPRHREQALEAYVERYGRGGWRGLSVPNIQLHRFGSTELAPIINRLWAEPIENPDVREMLLLLIAVARVSECADLLATTATDAGRSSTERVFAIEGLMRIGDPRLGTLVEAMAADGAEWPDRLAVNIIERLFPANMTASQLCSILGRLKKGKKNAERLDWDLPRLITRFEIRPYDLEILRDGLLSLVGAGIRWQDGWPRIVSDNLHLANALAATCSRGIDTSRDHKWLDACAVAIHIQHRHSDAGPRKELVEKIAKFDGGDFSRFFWASTDFVQRLNPSGNPRSRLREIVHTSELRLSPERDLDWIERDLADTGRTIDERTMMLQAAVWLPLENRFQERLAELRPLIADDETLLSVLDEFAAVPEKDPEEEEYKLQAAKYERDEKRKKERDRASWIKFRQRVLEHPDEVFSETKEEVTAWNMARVMSHDSDDQRWNRQFVEQHFDKPTAERLRQALMRLWRRQHPTLPSERPENERNSYSSIWVLGLAGVYAEAEDREWAGRLSDADAELAARLAQIKLNGLPKWLGDLIAVRPEAVDRTLGEELTWELHQPLRSSNVNLLQNIRYAPATIAAAFVPRILAWLRDDVGTVEGANSDDGAHRVDLAVRTVLQHGGSEGQHDLRELAMRRLEEKIPLSVATIWLSVLLRVDPSKGVPAFERYLEHVPPSKYSSAVSLFGGLFGDRQDSVVPSSPPFTPELLLTLVRLGYEHVRAEFDWEHEGSYSPDVRDDAERGRDAIIKALLDARGDRAWEAKVAMAHDPLCAHFKDRILSRAEEAWAEEIDRASFDEAQVVEFDGKGEATPSTNEAMFCVMVDRIERIKDSLLLDDTNRDLLASVRDEHVMRRQIANMFRQHAHGLYRVNQENVTADEKESDIRLSSLRSDHEAVVELKVGENDWSANVLRDTIRTQLVSKYMAPDTRRSGCLMITLSKAKQWRHPDTGVLIDGSGLIEVLEQEARAVEQELGSSVRLLIAIIDLRPRLATENVRRAAANSEA